MFLAAIGDARDRGAKALETFAYRYREAESQYERFQVHKTIFPSDFLADFGFLTLRRAGNVELARLELGGLVPVVEGKREKVIRVVKEAFAPAPEPVPRAFSCACVEEVQRKTGRVALASRRSVRAS